MNKNLDRDKIWRPYLFWTLGLSYALWFAIIIGNQFGILTFGTSPMMILYMLGANIPPIMAFVLLICSKQRTFKQLVKEIFSLKQPIQFYAVAVGLPILACIIPLLFHQASIAGPFYAPLFMIPVMMIFGGGLEEVGWRFILQPALEERMHFIPATLVTGVTWAVWHLPLFIMKGADQYTWSFWSFAIWAIGLAFALAVLYKLSKSAWLCILFHSFFNSMTDFIAVEYQDVPTSILGALILVVISLILLSVFKKDEIRCKSSLFTD